MLENTKPDIKTTRARIDEVDRKIASLFEERMALMEDVHAYKKARGLPVLDPGREEAVLEKAALRVQDPAIRPLYLELQKEIMRLGRARQKALSEEEETAP